MQTMLQTTLSLLIGAVITVNGVNANMDAVIKDTKKAVNGANLHQIATVLEVYYTNTGSYPEATNGEELIDLFEKEGYILNRPIDPNVFQYGVNENGENYTLSIAK